MLALTQSSHVTIAWRERVVRLEHAWVGASHERRDAPLLVFLHEGLGSLSMWRDFPSRLCQSLGARGLVYSRPGYGKSSPHPADQPLNPDFMHQQALEVLPMFMQALGIDASRDKPWLVGHSDGGSIALIHAAHHPDRVAGLVLMAPHIKVEALSVASIEKTRDAFLRTDMAAKLSRHHDDVAGAFWGWNNVWLSPAFRAWSIEQDIRAITCPVLAIQGLDDEYGTLAQIHGIAAQVPQTRCVELAQCGHSPHRDQPEVVIEKVCAFIENRPRVACIQ